MATYDNLPVYKESYLLLVELFRFTKNFTREYKYTLGESIKNETVTMITHIYRANCVKEGRIVHITSARESVELVRLFIRLLHDLHQVDLDTFIMLNMKLESVSKQLFGWQQKCSTVPVL
jgi:hypothetical protein